MLFILDHSVCILHEQRNLSIDGELLMNKFIDKREI